MLPTRAGILSAAAAAAVTLGVAFALPAAALPGDDPSCPEGSQKTCTQTPPEKCPAGTTPAGVQPPAGEGVLCNIDSLVRARAKADVLTPDQVLKLCADVTVRHLANVRVAVGHPKYEIITLDGKTCAPPKKPTYQDCWTAEQAGYHDIPKSDPRYDKRLDRDNDGIACETPAEPPASPAPPSAPLPIAPAPTIVGSHLPVTH